MDITCEDFQLDNVFDGLSNATVESIQQPQARQAHAQALPQPQPQPQHYYNVYPAQFDARVPPPHYDIQQQFNGNTSLRGRPALSDEQRRMRIELNRRAAIKYRDRMRALRVRNEQ